MSSTNLTCLCGKINTPCIFAKGLKFPIQRPVCHCNPCRQATGGLYGVFPPLAGPVPDAVLALCTRYDSLGSKGMQRFFCTQCGTQVCFFDQGDGNWNACGGAIETPGETLSVDRIRAARHIFLNDTRDGGIVGARPGLATMRPDDSSPSTDRVPCYAEWPKGDPLSLSALQTMTTSPGIDTASDTLTARCHCGGVDLRIQRPSPSPSTEISSTPTTPKYSARLCSCRSCRLANGAATLQPWTRVPAAHVVDAGTGQPVATIPPNGANSGQGDGRQPAATGLKRYWSSEKVCWSFCARCGATVLYETTERPGMLALAVGVLRAPEGAMARSWLQWDWTGIDFVEEAVDRELCWAILA